MALFATIIAGVNHRYFAVKLIFVPTFKKIQAINSATMISVNSFLLKGQVHGST